VSFCTAGGEGIRQWQELGCAVLAVLAGLAPAADAQPTRTDMAAAKLRDGTALKLQDNRAVLPPDGAGALLKPFLGTLSLSNVLPQSPKRAAH
jgi:hypothetical protein